MGLKIDFHSDSLTVDLGSISTDRKKARIKFSSIRSLTQCTDNETVQIVFNNGEIQGFPYTLVDEIDGDTAIDSQDILYDKMEIKIFVN